MKSRGVVLAAVFLFSFIVLLAPQGYAVKRTELWTNMCETCHNGKTAPDADWMRDHYRGADDFVAAVKGRGKQCMNILKHDETLARKIAAEIGIPDRQEK
jgi:hypothetical protein